MPDEGTSGALPITLRSAHVAISHEATACRLTIWRCGGVTGNAGEGEPRPGTEDCSGRTSDSESAASAAVSRSADSWDQRASFRIWGIFVLASLSGALKHQTVQASQRTNGDCPKEYNLLPHFCQRGRLLIWSAVTVTAFGPGGLTPSPVVMGRFR